jgi:N-acetylglucosaminyldiphosphoundecaprenol N-acetyl-beta-D-mannosaminyltransferase
MHTAALSASTLRIAPRVVESPATAPALPPTVSIVGIPLALTDYAAMVELIDAYVASRRRGYACVCNVYTVMVAEEDPEVRAALFGSSVNVPDGQPLVWAINLLGHPLHERVYGPELMSRACARAAKTGQRLYLYGGRNQGALVQLSLNLRRMHPGIQIVGGYSPPHRPLTAEERESVIEEMNRSRADVVWVGIGAPKQEKWMAEMRPHLQAPMLLGVGAAFDFHAGLVPQAPPRLQNAGLEWAFRLTQEPQRLWRRYLRYNPRFMAAFARQFAGHLRTRSGMR